jgi:hypothetical protein
MSGRSPKVAANTLLHAVSTSSSFLSHSC